MGGEILRVNRDGGVVTLEMHRPEVLNAISPELAAALLGAVQECDADEAVRVVVLTGSGRAFSSGGDMKALGAALAAGGDLRSLVYDALECLHEAVLSLRRLPKPAVAAINGVVGGVGVALAAACDLRVAARSAVFKAAYSEIGLTPDGGWSALVPRLVGVGRAAEMLFLDQPVPAERALEWGLVHEVCDDDKLPGRTMELAHRMAQLPPGSLAAAKRLLDAHLLPALEDAMQRDREAVLARLATPEMRARLAGFLAR
mgnify:CR=1 FL=1